VQPSILNLKREEYPARPEHAPNFRESAILHFVRTQMMKHEDRDCRRKCAIRKRQRRSISLDHRRIAAAHASTELRRRRVVVLKTGHPSSEVPQLLRCRSGPRTQLQHMIAKLRALENPRQKLPPRHVPPKR